MVTSCALHLLVLTACCALWTQPSGTSRGFLPLAQHWRAGTVAARGSPAIFLPQRRPLRAGARAGVSRAFLPRGRQWWAGTRAGAPSVLLSQVPPLGARRAGIGAAQALADASARLAIEIGNVVIGEQMLQKNQQHEAAEAAAEAEEATPELVGEHLNDFYKLLKFVCDNLPTPRPKPTPGAPSGARPVPAGQAGAGAAIGALPLPAGQAGAGAASVPAGQAGAGAASGALPLPAGQAGAGAASGALPPPAGQAGAGAASGALPLSPGQAGAGAAPASTIGWQAQKAGASPWNKISIGSNVIGTQMSPARPLAVQGAFPAPYSTLRTLALQADALPRAGLGYGAVLRVGPFAAARRPPSDSALRSILQDLAHEGMQLASGRWT